MKINSSHFIALLIFLGTVVTGFIISGDYGISWDDPSQRAIGITSYDYMFTNDKEYEKSWHKEYGTAFQVPLIVIEKALNIKDPREIYRVRHLCTFLFFAFSAFIFYFLIWSLYRKRTLAIAGYLMLLLSPRIFSHAFFNSKDIPFMSMFIICFYLFYLAFSKRKIIYFFLFGICCGLLINIRVMGLILVLFTLFIMLADLFMEDRKKNLLFFILVYSGVTIIVTVLTWPYLWHNPLKNFFYAFTSMSHYHWDNYILMFGKFIRSTNIPWWYTLAWMGVTIPIVYLVIGIGGFILLLRQVIIHSVRYLFHSPERNQLLFIMTFSLPLLAVIIFHSVLYDGWRQMYFIYPSFLLFAVYGISAIMNSTYRHSALIKTVTSGFLLFSFCMTGFFMIKNHPFQDIYFNKVVSHRKQYLRKNFEMDYWGTSYKQALEYIVHHDTSDHLNIMTANLSGEQNVMMLNGQDRERIKVVYSFKKANYFISNYRWHPEDYPYLPNEKFYNIVVLNSDILSVWKLR